MGSVPGHQALKQGGPMRLKHSKHIVDVLRGYPNWWASIPMPIAAFLESQGVPVNQ